MRNNLGAFHNPYHREAISFQVSRVGGKIVPVGSVCVCVYVVGEHVIVLSAATRQGPI